jgi:pimeloyl-ACP methyl ester carboxylesterase
MASKEIDYNGTRYTLSYELRNPSAQESLLILHGWGSNKTLMAQAFGTLLPSYKHIYLDMPGFGNSPNDTVLTTHDYAEIVARFLDALGMTPRIVMGHSFGGKVATLLNPPCLVLLSSSGILVPKPLKVRLKIALFKALKPLGLSKIREFFVSDDAKGMSPAMYETFKNVVNEDFEANFENVKGEALLFWGKEDTATPLWTAEKIAEKIENARLFPLEGDHYFFLHHAPFIAETIERHCKG